jgi:hypothetical protein
MLVTARAARRAARRVDAASLAVLRVALGLVVVLSAVRTWAYGWTDSLYAGPTHRFTYLWLGWVPQPGPLGIRALVAATALAGLAIAVGWRTRLVAAVLLVTFGWIEAIDATTYLNHYWFVTLLALLATVVPFGATWSLDARRRRRSRAGRDESVALGWVWLLRFQVGVVYASAGLAKLQPDWLLRGIPLRFWLPARSDVPLIGPLLRAPETAHVLSVAGAAFDCLVVPLLLWRRTRLWAWLAVVAFHLITWRLFPIGVFPWLMAAMATVFFDPSWPRDLRHRIRREPIPPRPVDQLAPRPAEQPAPRPVEQLTPRPVEQLAPPPAEQLAPRPVEQLAPTRPPTPAWRTRLLGAAAVVWVAIQIALPLRHLAYPGDHRITAEGYRFGWNVLLVERVASVTFLVRDPTTGRTWTFDPDELYTPTQLRVMRSEPDLIQQAAHAIADHESTPAHRVEVRVDAWLSFNGRPAFRWIDPDVDLAAQPRTPWHKPWIESGP